MHSTRQVHTGGKTDFFSLVKNVWMFLFFLSLDIQIPPEVWCFRYVFGAQLRSQEVFGCLGYEMHHQFQQYLGQYLGSSLSVDRRVLSH